MNNEDGFSRLQILIAIVVIVLLGFGGLLVSRRRSASSQENKPTTAQTAPTISPAEVTDSINSAYVSKYKILNYFENENPAQGQMSVRIESISPLYKFEGYDFYTDYDGGSSILLIAGPVNLTTDTFPRSVDTAIRTEISVIFKKFGLIKVGAYGNKQNGSELDEYKGNGLICTIQAPDTITSTTEATCGEINSYKSEAAKAKPIASAIPNASKSTILAGLRIKNSAVSGYQKANAIQGNIDNLEATVALFYKKNNDAWVYFKNHSKENDLPCSDYSTLDLRNAFKGDACYGPKNQSTTVQ